MSLSKLKETVNGAITDLATLEVATFTGSEINLENVEQKNVFEQIRSNLTTSTLVAYSRYEVEGDAMNYTNADLGEDKKYLLDAHNAMVIGAQQSRKDFFEFVLDVVNVKID